MARNKCLVCQKSITLEEGNLCAVCEEKGDFRIGEIPNNVNCGTCELIVEEDSEGLTCDMCGSWYHNNCCKTPLIEALYSLLNEAPHNVKWFCDKCVWETEKWIERYNDGEVRGGVRNKEAEYDTTYNLKEPEIKLEIENEDIPIGFDDSWSNYSSDYDEERKFKKKKKIKKKQFQCNQCEKSFSTKTYLKKHMDNLNHHGKEPYKCKHCEEYFANKGALRKHMQTHPEYEPENEMEGMSDDFDDTKPNNSEGNEVTKKKPRSKNIFQCSKCERKFQYKKTYSKHIDTCDHTGAITYQCKHCEESFSNKKDRRKHQKKHTKRNKQCQCSHCGKVFRNQYHLTRHESIHTGEKPHQCGHCGKMFASRDKMVRHERIHTGEKPYECGYCGRDFARLDNFKTHERTHTGEKPYQCNHCDKSFINRSNLNQHLRSHSEEQPFKLESSITDLPIFTKKKSTLPVSKTPMTSMQKTSFNTLPIFTKRKPTQPVSANPIPSTTKSSQLVHDPPMPSFKSEASLQQPSPITSSSSTHITPPHQMPIHMMSSQALSCTQRAMPPLKNMASYQHAQPNIHYASMPSPNASSNHSNTPTSPSSSIESTISDVHPMNSNSMHTSYMPLYSMPSTHIPTNMGAQPYHLTILDGRHESLQ